MLETAPTRLVENRRQQLGRFSGPIQAVNLIDARYLRLPRALRWLRLKEWEAIQVTTPSVFVSVALFDAKVMSLMQVKIYDRERGEKIVHEWTLRPRAFTVADQLLDSTTRFADKRGSLEFRNELARDRIAVTVELHATATLPRVAGRFELATARGASQVVSLPFAGDVGMYSHKGVFPVTGQLVVGDREFDLDRALAFFDDHKGYYPYVMRWDWVSATARVDGRARGFNLTRNQCREPDRFNENCAWEDDRIGLLPAVEFVREQVRERDERWLIKDRDGRVDLVFTPTVPGEFALNAIILQSKYRGPFGHVTGTLRPEGLAPFTVDGWFGMGEDFYLRC